MGEREGGGTVESVDELGEVWDTWGAGGWCCCGRRQCHHLLQCLCVHFTLYSLHCIT